MSLEEILGVRELERNRRVEIEPDLNARESEMFALQIALTMSLQEAKDRLKAMANSVHTDVVVGDREKAAMFIALGYMRVSITRMPQPIDSWTTRGEAY